MTRDDKGLIDALRRIAASKFTFPLHVRRATEIAADRLDVLLADGTDAAAEDEAFMLLGLIDAEFRSDPSSVQCFDRRIVEQVRAAVAARERR